jgi:hypothetical protein
MTEKACPQEKRIREALTGGDWTPEISTHLAVCPLCRETAVVVSAMKRIGSEAGERFAGEARISDAAALLRRARSRRLMGVGEAGEILKPLRFYRRFVLPLGLVAGFLIAVFNIVKLKKLFFSLPGISAVADRIRTLSARPEGEAFVIVAAFSCLGLLILAVLTSSLKGKPEKS